MPKITLSSTSNLLFLYPHYSFANRLCHLSRCASTTPSPRNESKPFSHLLLWLPRDFTADCTMNINSQHKLGVIAIRSFDRGICVAPIVVPCLPNRLSTITHLPPCEAGRKLASDSSAKNRGRSKSLEGRPSAGALSQR